jgi:hypothetical protein
MLSIYITLAIAAFQIGYGSAVPQPTPSVSSSSIIPGLTAGYTNPILSYSKGGNAICVTGNVPISITATTTHILLPEPANQTVLTEIIQEFIQVDSNIVTRTDGGSVTTQGTFSIDTTYCVPANPSVNPKSIQLLIHGLSLDKTYWDIAPGYSYVDAAALAGYATIAYNRLGVGNSDHPDPLQVVQGTVDVEIQHGLTQLLRNGWVNGRKYQNVVAAGHSYGSIVLLAQAAKYPSDVQAAIITGFVNDLAYIGYTLGSLDPAIAALNDPAEFGSLPYGYMVPDTSISVQLPFFRFPYFPASGKLSCQFSCYHLKLTAISVQRGLCS